MPNFELLVWRGSHLVNRFTCQTGQYATADTTGWWNDWTRRWGVSWTRQGFPSRRLSPADQFWGLPMTEAGARCRFGPSSVLDIVFQTEIPFRSGNEYLW